MRRQVDTQSVPGDQQIKQVVAKHLNVVFGDTQDSKIYWHNKLREALLLHFPNALSNDVRQIRFSNV